MNSTLRAIVWERDRTTAMDAYYKLRDEYGSNWLGYKNDRMPIEDIFKGEITPLKKRDIERFRYSGEVQWNKTQRKYAFGLH